MIYFVTKMWSNILGQSKAIERNPLYDVFLNILGKKEGIRGT